MSASRVVGEGSRYAQDGDRDATEAPRKERIRSHASVDRYAVFDLGREHHLSANERWLLLALCLAADFRTCAVSATIWQLSEWTGIGRDTVPKCLRVLEKAGLVEVLYPFGPNRAGEVAILVWKEIIVEKREPKSRIRPPRDRGQVADKSRASRGPVADKSANDQGERSLYRGEEEEGCTADSYTGDGHDKYSQVEGLSGGNCAIFDDPSFWDPEPITSGPDARCSYCGGVDGLTS
jgi:hypothetical protein